jgi:pimeloyl-ACP methyl ester carboxylesterase
MFQTDPNGTAYEIFSPDQSVGAASDDLPLIVFIHGLGLNRACWQWTTPAFKDRYRVLVYDIFGHGDSAAPPQTPSLSMFSRQLTDLLDHVGAPNASIVGFSLGGMIARRIAQDAPLRVTSLAILHSPHQRSAAAQYAIEKRVEMARTQGPSSTIEAALDRWFTKDFHANNPKIMDQVRSWVTSNPIDIYHTIYRVLANGIDEITAPQPPISCPTLVITADQDYGNGPEMTHAIAAEIPGATALILPGLRHMALAQSPEAINAPLHQFFKTHLTGNLT